MFRLDIILHYFDVWPYSEIDCQIENSLSLEDLKQWLNDF